MLKPGELAPDVTLPDTDGVVHTLPQLLTRGPLVLVFFKISCPVCQLALPFLERLTASPHLQVVGVSQDDRPSTVEFLNRFQLHFPTLLDDSRNYRVSNEYTITNVPSLFLVEGDKSIAWASHGFSRKDLEELGRRAATEIFRAGEQVPEWKPG